MAEKLEFVEIKVSCKDIVVIGKALQQAYPEKKGQIVSDLKLDFKKASKIAKEIIIPSEPDIEPVPGL